MRIFRGISPGRSLIYRRIVQFYARKDVEMLDGTRDAFPISGVAMGSQGFGSIDWNIRVLGFYRIEHVAPF